ncbi:probable nadh-ubiquinone oxidoreductase 21 kda subunit [Rhynchosporium agropyri]|uniref:Probable nadh-ubiquinone oxidoreductase 21 kDa subunit n=3 Tax=Rhynchosporium TaxID=38037 RepID=A0A1E1MNF1_RHYSE|nr:probable nadh-ubiquinone oxidoreductase 21 kda subunit [Rhynchosporium commune]CZS99597.1 probable nadh-ubiquinone oxidoreductase 21 kda subunit [Rhynchosporium agropyri]CZT50624.1 probable nadh-ubiquinone oxidoreductase 21 kda subunit [Rhynchosporium secalis]
MSNIEQRPYVPAKTIDSDYPLIDSDPHIKRVIKYARKSDYAVGAATATFAPGMMLLWEQIAPSLVGKGGFAPIMRLSGTIGLSAGFLMFYQRSIYRFYGFNENAREVKMDMEEMVAKVKKGEPLYGVSTLTPYMQGVASRNSRYSGVFLHAVPWFNFVNHNQHGVDTAKYYRQAERELAAEGK